MRPRAFFSLMNARFALEGTNSHAQSRTEECGSSHVYIVSVYKRYLQFPSSSISSSVLRASSARFDRSIANTVESTRSSAVSSPCVVGSACLVDLACAGGSASSAEPKRSRVMSIATVKRRSGASFAPTDPCRDPCRTALA